MEMRLLLIPCSLCRSDAELSRVSRANSDIAKAKCPSMELPNINVQSYRPIPIHFLQSHDCLIVGTQVIAKLICHPERTT